MCDLGTCQEIEFRKRTLDTLNEKIRSRNTGSD